MNIFKLSASIFAIVSFVAFLVYYSIKKTNLRAEMSCMRSQKSIGNQLAMYVQDYDGYFPREDVFTEGKFSSVSIESCPSAVRSPAYDELKRSFEKQKFPGYAYNSNLSMNTEYRSESTHRLDPTQAYLYHRRHVSEIVYPGNTVEVAEAPAGILTAQSASHKKYGQGKLSKMERAWERHRGGANYLFCDGHTRWLRVEQFAPSSDPEHDVNDGRHPSLLVRSKPLVDSPIPHR